MKYSECSEGRVFILRLEEGEILHEAVESFASDKGITSATVIAVGGADAGSKLTVGPKLPISSPVAPTHHVLDAPHELTGTGTIFSDHEGRPVLHMHCSCGRGDTSITGCVRSGVKVWLVMEVIITELKGCKAKRIPDERSGFGLLEPNGG